MSQSDHPHDPFAKDIEPTPESAPQQPAQDPYAAPQSPYGAPQDPSASAQSPYGAPQDPSAAPQDPYAAPQQPYAAPQQEPHSAPQGQYAAPGQDQHSAAGAAAGTLTGPALNPSDSRMWAMFSQLSVVLGQVVSWGFLGWVGPLIIFIMYKDRDRLVRHHAAESLNGAIAVVIAEVALAIVLGIFTVVTFGLGSFLLVLVPVPALVQLIFAIIGAVKANQGEYWKYPLNIRLVK